MTAGSKRLAFFRDYWPTDKGAWFPGEKVLYRGKSLFDDFNDRSWMTLFIYGFSNRMPQERVSRLVEMMWKICTSFPDPRLWNNRVGALAGSTRTTAPLALAAATAVSEASIYGRRPDLLGAEFLQAVAALDGREERAEYAVGYLKRYRTIPGFGRPLISVDERIEPLMAGARELGLEDGRFLALVTEIEDILSERRYRLKANISIYCAALLADAGLSPREFYYVAILAFSAGVLPCYLDAAEKPEGCLFPLQCEDISYSGHQRRRL